MTMPLTLTLTEELLIEKTLPTKTNITELDVPSEKIDLARIPKRAPPSKGMCLRCGENKPINRLMLCYPCWVKTRLEEKGWREGQPHPDSCGCSLPAHQSPSSGN